jgi:hypothetical protein
MYLSSKFIRLYYTNRIFVKITRTLKKCIYTESLKELVKYKYYIFNDKIRKTLISTGGTISLCYDLEYFKTVRGHIVITIIDY